MVGVYINQHITKVSKDDLSNYPVIPLIVLFSMFYELAITWIIPVQQDIDETLR